MANILIVDDSEISRAYLLNLLGYLGHSMLEAADGDEALALVRAAKPDLIISDIKMPKMSGIAFMEALQQDADTAQIPVIFNSASYRIPDAIKIAKACRAVSFIPKPAEPEMIINAVKLALSNTRTVLQTSAIPEHPGEHS